MCPLTPAKLRVLEHFAAGYTIHNTSVRLKLSKHTINQWVKDMREVTKTTNVVALVAKALREGWIK